MIKENIFGGKRLFTTTEPSDCNIKKISASEFARSTERFLNECFRGAIDLTIDDDAFGFVEISVHGFAYLVKLVLSKIYGKRVLKSSLTFTRESILFSVDFGSDAEEDDIKDTLAAAKRCGMTGEANDSRLVFYAPVLPNTLISLYARDSIYSLSVYNEVFFI